MHYLWNYPGIARLYSGQVESVFHFICLMLLVLQLTGSENVQKYNDYCAAQQKWVHPLEWLVNQEHKNYLNEAWI